MSNTEAYTTQLLKPRDIRENDWVMRIGGTPIGRVLRKGGTTGNRQAYEVTIEDAKGRLHETYLMANQWYSVGRWA